MSDSKKELEEWCQVEDIEFLKVSNMGNVIRFNHRWGKWIPGNVKRQEKDGYVYYEVTYMPDKKTMFKKERSVLVAEAFLQKEEGKPYVRHKDGDSTNDRADNLYYSAEPEFIKKLDIYKAYLELRPHIKEKLKEVGSMKEVAEMYGFLDSTLLEYVKKDPELYSVYSQKKNNLSSRRKKAAQTVGTPIPFGKDESLMQIRDFPYNLVSDKGIVYTFVEETGEYYTLPPVKKGREMALELMNASGNQVEKPVAELVADCFLEGGDHVSQFLLHLDGDIRNNSTDNLMWLTANERQLFKKKKRIIKLMTENMGYSRKEAVACVIGRKNSRTKAVPKGSDEEWRDIEDFDGYMVSDMGHVRKMEPDGTITLVNEFIRMGKKDVVPYVRLVRPDGRQSLQKVANLVAGTFLRKSGRYMVVGHKDGNEENNRADNLFWEPRNNYRAP